MQRGRSRLSISELISKGVLVSGQELRFRGQPELTGSITPQGEIRYGDVTYKSPSTAAKAVIGGGSTNGWLAWRALAGDAWVPLASLRELIG